jgi:hypothetical protein
VAEGRHGEGCGCVRCTGFTESNLVALRHGATSERQVSPVARNHKRRFLRQIGTRVSDLDPIGRAYLDQASRLAAKVELIDRYVDEQGLIRPDGEPQPVMRLYVSLQNSLRLALARLEQHLRSREDPSMVVVLQGQARGREAS